LIERGGSRNKQRKSVAAGAKLLLSTFSDFVKIPTQCGGRFFFLSFSFFHHSFVYPSFNLLNLFYALG
jgi:hypothetical protein